MITLTEVDSIIQELAKERPIFHSEADFQHALAWMLHEHYPSLRVRLEVNPYKDGQRAYQDILLRSNGAALSLELKYKTRKLDYSYDDEDFHLLDQSAQDIGRYDFIKDIVRLERFVKSHPSASGIAIFLSNDASYWKSARENTVDVMFRIHENVTLRGKLGWGDLASAGTMRGREKILELLDEYPLVWKDYSHLDGVRNGEFRYLMLAVGGSG